MVRVLILIGGAILSVISAPGLVGMLREELHIGCFYGTVGEAAGAWMCTDGIGYIFPGLALLFGAVLPLLVALLVLPAAQRERTRRRTLTLLAFVPLLWAVGWLGSSTVIRTDALPYGETWLRVWLIHVGISAALALAGAALVALSPIRPGRASHLVRIAGGSLVLAATIVQPGLAFATIALAALLIAARLVPASSRRASRTRSETGVSAG